MDRRRRFLDSVGIGHGSLELAVQNVVRGHGDATLHPRSHYSNLGFRIVPMGFELPPSKLPGQDFLLQLPVALDCD